MSCRLCFSPTVSFPSDSGRTSVRQSFRYQVPFFISPLSTSSRLSWSGKVPKPAKRRRVGILSMAQGNGGSEKWLMWLPRGPVAERVFRLIAGAMSSPVGQYVSSPVTFLHVVDARVKLAWLLALVVLPSRSHIVMRFGLVAFLAVMSVWVLPKDVWTDQLGRVTLLSGILFLMLGFGSDGAPPLVQLRTPPPSLMGLPELPLSGYSYTILKLGPLQLTRKGLSVASTSACLSFTVLLAFCAQWMGDIRDVAWSQYDHALILSFSFVGGGWSVPLTVWLWFMIPLKFVGVPVAEIILTLLLSLRFISIVFDEVRNAAMAIVSRRIKWEQLTVMETLDIFIMYVRRIFANIFKHAEQITQAMIVRGFRGDSNIHKIYFFSNTSFGIADMISLLGLLGLIGASIVSEQILV